MAGSTSRDRVASGVPIVGALLLHVLLGGGLEAADRWAEAHPHTPTVVELEIKAPPIKKKIEPKPLPPPAPKKEEEKKPDPPPPPPDKKVVKKIAKADVKPDPRPPEDKPPEDKPPPPGPDNANPDDEYDGPPIHIGDGPGSMGVKTGTGHGALNGDRGKKGQGPKGGGADDSKGVEKVASVASIKKQAAPAEAYDRLPGSEYPEQARQAGVEGDVVVKFIVTAQGTVKDPVLVKGLGYGLDDKAIALCRTFKFHPAIDTNGNPVASQISWTFHFKAP